MLKKFKKWFAKSPEPILIKDFPAHLISSHALKVLQRLKEANFEAYLVGGCVRDLLLGHRPKDFDIATNAHPEQIKSLFHNCLLIGRRFRLAHIRFGREVIEVATFRSAPLVKSHRHRVAPHGMILRDNVYGTVDDDVKRRDFTINALYYDACTYSIIDYYNGLQDLKDRCIRIIGDPKKRYREDPVRLLRIIRFSGKLQFKIHPQSEACIRSLSPLLSHVSPARLFDEAVKLLQSGCSVAIIRLLRHYELFQELFPQTDCYLKQGLQAEQAEKLLNKVCYSTDNRVLTKKKTSPAFILAALLWYPYLEQKKLYLAQGLAPAMACQKAVRDVIAEQKRRTSIPQYLTAKIMDILQLQSALERRPIKRILKIFQHPSFRAAYDFLVLRAETQEIKAKLADWWTHFQNLDPAEQEHLIKKLSKSKV